MDSGAGAFSELGAGAGVGAGGRGGGGLLLLLLPVRVEAAPPSCGLLADCSTCCREWTSLSSPSAHATSVSLLPPASDASPPASGEDVLLLVCCTAASRAAFAAIFTAEYAVDLVTVFVEFAIKTLDIMLSPRPSAARSLLRKACKHTYMHVHAHTRAHAQARTSTCQVNPACPNKEEHEEVGSNQKKGKRKSIASLPSLHRCRPPVCYSSLMIATAPPSRSLAVTQF